MSFNPIARLAKLLAPLVLFQLLFCVVLPKKAHACGQGAYAPQVCQVSSFTNANGGPAALYTTTGNPAVDQWLGVEINFAQNQFGVRPAFFVFDDRHSPNAYATNRVYHPAFRDGAVAFGLQLLSNEIYSTNSYCSSAAIVAHEYAHILQFKYGTPLRGKYVELQADFLAGWYIQRRGWLTWTNAAAALHTFYQRGRYGYASDSHGTPEERARAFAGGWQNGALPLPQAWVVSMQYVTNASGVR